MFSPNNIPQLSPYFIVKDGAKAIEFYRSAFSFTIEEVNKNEQGEIGHVLMRKQDAIIMFAPQGHRGSTKKTPATLNLTMPISTYIYCEDVDDLYETAISYGAKSLIAPTNIFWGERYCSLLDQDGYEWSFATILKK